MSVARSTDGEERPTGTGSSLRPQSSSEQTKVKLQPVLSDDPMSARPSSETAQSTGNGEPRVIATGGSPQTSGSQVTSVHLFLYYSVLSQLNV